MESDRKRSNEILQRIIEIFREELAPDKILLFGSRGKAKHQKGSDFDIAINDVRPELEIQRKILERIDEVAGLYSVDVVYLRSVDKKFRDIIQKTGKVIYEKRDPIRHLQI